MGEQVTCLVFLDGTEVSAWMVPEDFGIRAGQRMTLDINVPAGVDIAEGGYQVVGHAVARMTDYDADPDGVTITYLVGQSYAGDLTARLLAGAGWRRLDPPFADAAATVVARTLPSAATHEVVLVAADPAALAAGDYAQVSAWTRDYFPEDPELPLFGQRIPFDPVGSITDDTADEDLNADPLAPGTLRAGLGTVVATSGVVSPGVGQVVLWTASLGEVDEFFLTAGGWTRLAGDGFDPAGFRLAERVDLALRTELTVEVDEDGEEYLAGYALGDAASVSPDQYDLLPGVLVRQAKAAAEIEDIDAVLARWRAEGTGAA